MSKGRTVRPRIVRSKDCGNSPKNLLAESLAIALATGNAKAALPLLAEDAAWEIIGRSTITGRAAIEMALSKARKVKSVTIQKVLTHGRSGAVSGTIGLSAAHVRRFCDLYEFSGAGGKTVRRVTSFDLRG